MVLGLIEGQRETRGEREHWWEQSWNGGDVLNVNHIKSIVGMFATLNVAMMADSQEERRKNIVIVTVL